MKKKYVKPLGSGNAKSKDLSDCFPAVHLPQCNSKKGVDPCDVSCKETAKLPCQSECKFGCKGSAKAPPPPKSR